MATADQTVTVSADASLINYETPPSEAGVSPETLQNFPLVISGAPRSSVTVAIFMPGVTTGGGGNAYNSRTNGGIITGDEAVVDGATAAEGFMNQSGMVSLQTDFGMSPDITSEVKILAANYDAQYGNSTSGQLIVQTRSGGEQFHGAAYEYLRNDALNAKQYGASKQDTRQGKRFRRQRWRPHLDSRVSQPNASGKRLLLLQLGRLSGSRRRQFLHPFDRLFGRPCGKLQRRRQPTLLSLGPGQVWGFGRSGHPQQPDRPQFEDPIAKAFMAQLPTPTNGQEVNNYFIPRAGQGSLTNSENVYFFRIDANVGQKDHFYYTFWWQFSGVNAQTDLPVALSTASPANPENAPIQRLNWEHTLSSHMTNHATVGYLSRNEGYYALNGKAKLPTVPGVANPSYQPQMNFGGGYSQLGNSNAAQFNCQPDHPRNLGGQRCLHPDPGKTHLHRRYGIHAQRHEYP